LIAEKVIPSLLSEFRTIIATVVEALEESEPDLKRRKLTDGDSFDFSFDIAVLSRAPCAQELADLQLLMRHVFSSDKYLLKEILHQLGLRGAFLPVDPTRAVIKLEDPEQQRRLSSSTIVSVYKRLDAVVRQQAPNLLFLIHHRAQVPVLNSDEWKQARQTIKQLIQSCVNEIDTEQRQT
jgi:hypothetical protein